MINLEKKSELLLLGSAVNFIVWNSFILFFSNLLILWVILFGVVEALLFSGGFINPLINKIFNTVGENSAPPVQKKEPPANPPPIVTPAPPIPEAIPTITPAPTASAEKEIPRPILPPNTQLFAKNIRASIESPAENNPSPILSAVSASFAAEIMRPYLDPKPREIITPPPAINMPPHPEPEITATPEPEITATVNFSPGTNVIPRPLASSGERHIPIISSELSEKFEELEESIDLSSEETGAVNAEQLDTLREIRKVPRRIKHRGIRLKSVPPQS